MFSVIFADSDRFRYVSAFMLLAIVVAVAVKVYRVFTHPLKNVPGPPLARWTDLWIKKETCSGERPRYVHSLHQRYGPIVRISANEVSIADVNAARTVYKIGTPYYKTSFYDAFGPATPVKSLFSMRDPKAHARHRQNAAFYFSEKYIEQLEPIMVAVVHRAIRRMAEQIKTDGFVDIFKWLFCMATDVIGEAAFGESFKTLESEKMSSYMDDLRSFGEIVVMKHEFPLPMRALSMLPLRRQKDAAATTERIRQYATQSIERYWKLLRADPESAKLTLLTKEYGMVENGELPLTQLVRDAFAYLVAGTDTTSNTLTYTIYELSQHPEIEKELIREVSSLQEGYTDHELRDLKVLNSVINESLRLNGAAPGALPRYVPPQGGQFCGHFIPGGTVVGIPAYTMHRDAAIWPNPERFDPDRWLELTKDQKDNFLPFGGGSRICIGMHFSRLEMRHTVAEFYRTFTSGVRPSTAEGFTEADMRPETYFLSTPRGKRCLIEPRA